MTTATAPGSLAASFQTVSANTPSEHLDGDKRYLDPRIAAQLSNLELVARFVVEGFMLGLHRSPFHGYSAEFSAYRKYVRGDNLRHVDWKLYARCDRIYVKLFEENTNLTTYLLLDASASMQFDGSDAPGASTQPARKSGWFGGGKKSAAEPASSVAAGNKPVSKFDYAAMAAASLSYLLLKQNDSVGLVTFTDERTGYIPPKARRTQLSVLLNAMHATKPTGGTNLVKGLHGLAEQAVRRGLIVLFSDLLADAEAILPVLSDLRNQGHEIIVFQIMTEAEWQFPYAEDYLFVDPETGAELVGVGRDLREGYLKELNDHCAKLTLACRDMNIDLVPLKTTDNLGQTLLTFLTKRARLM
ncbi:MAG TPA: DUF58 domain-containing protein [Planctomycetota bacterium]|nr:DUF58 domain-containing protein [Planctomycetota bacterium]